MRYKVPDELRAATFWAIEYWLILHDHQSDTSYGWHSMLEQFSKLVPSDDPACSLTTVAAEISLLDGYSVASPDQETPPPGDALSLLMQRASASIEAVLGE